MTGQRTLPALKRIFGPHAHDCATFEVSSATGEFILQAATGLRGRDPALIWNVCDWPPGFPPERFDRLDTGQGYVELGSEVTRPGAAAFELEQLVVQVGGAPYSVDDVETHRTATIAPRGFGAVASHLATRVREVFA
jgi:hypothetical protein